MADTLYSIDDLLEQMVARHASDLHVTVGVAPGRARARQARAPGGHPGADARGHAAAALPHPLDASSRSTSSSTARSTSRTRSPASRASASTSTCSASALGAAFRLIPTEIKTLEELGLPPALHELTEQSARPRARHRPDRLRQVDDARGADRRDQPHARRAHPHDRGPDRVRAPAQALHRQPARDRRRRDELRRGAARRAPPGPRRDPPRRDARPRDDLDRADRRRDRPPRLRHAAHAERARRRSTASSTSSRRRSRSRSASSSPARSRASSPRRCSRPPTARAVSPRSRSSFPDDAVRNLIRQAKVEQIYSVMQTGTQRGMQTMEQSLADLVLRGVDQPDVGALALQPARPAARPARARRLRGRRDAVRRADPDACGSRRPSDGHGTRRTTCSREQRWSRRPWRRPPGRRA